MKEHLMPIGIILILLLGSIGALGISLHEVDDFDENTISSSSISSTEEDESAELWTEDHGVTFKESLSRNSSIDMDNDGHLDVTWEDNRSDEWNIFYVKLRNHDGEKLISEFRVTDNEHLSYNPKVISHSEDNVSIVWQEKRENEWQLRFSRLEYSEREITRVNESKEILSLGESRSKNYTFVSDINEDGDNIFHIAYEKNSNIYYTRINTFGEIDLNDEESYQLTDSNVSSYDPRLELADDPNDGIHFFWIEPLEEFEKKNRGIFYRKIEIDDSLETLVPRRRMTVVNRMDRYDTTLDDEGNIHIVFDDDRFHEFKRDIIYRKLFSDGTMAIDDTLITPRENEANAFRPSISVDPNDDLTLVWADSRDHNGLPEDEKDVKELDHDIYFQYLDTDGEKIRPEERLTEESSLAIDPIIISDDDNEQHVIWEDSRREWLDIFYKRTHKPHLSVEDIRIKPEKPSYNSTVKVEIDLKNRGDGSINTTGSLYRKKGEIEECDINSEMEKIRHIDFSVDKRSEKTLKLDFRATNSGHQTLFFIANEDEEKLERYWDYKENSDCQIYTVLPDLDVRLLESERIIDSGETTNFTYELTNIVDLKQNLLVDIQPPEGIEIEDHTLETEEKYLFPLDLYYERHLEDENETVLIERFEKENYEFKEGSEIINETDEEKEWHIKVNGQLRYRVVEEDNELKVYRDITTLKAGETQKHRLDMTPDNDLLADEYQINITVQSIDRKRYVLDQQGYEPDFEGEFSLKINPNYDLTLDLREDNYDRTEDGKYIVENPEDHNHLLQLEVKNEGNVDHDIFIEDNRNETMVHWGIFADRHSLEPFETGYTFLFRSFDEEFVAAANQTIADEEFIDLFQEELRELENIPEDYEVSEDAEFHERDEKLFFRDDGKEYLIEVREEEVEVYTLPTLDVTNLKGMEEDFEVNVTAESWDEIELTETITIIIEGEEPVSFWQRIPWLWVALIPVIIFVGFIVVGRIYYTFIG